MPKAITVRSSERRREFRWRPYVVLPGLGRSLGLLEIIICLHQSTGQDLKDLEELLDLLSKVNGFNEGPVEHAGNLI